MSPALAPTCSRDNEIGLQSRCPIEDTSKYTYEISDSERRYVCYQLDANNVWEKAAEKMGYDISTNSNDLIKIQKMAHDKRITPAEQLLSLWDDQNHTITELFMVLYSINQFSAMNCLKGHVEKKYHRLLLRALPTFQTLNEKTSNVSRNNNNTRSEKILNVPEISRDTNESEYYSESLQTSCNTIVNREKIEQVAGLMPPIHFEELVTATQNWSKDNVLGRGGFGTVFKGRWKFTDVAIKKIEYNSGDKKKNLKVQMKQSENELRYLNSCRHDNVLQLLGYSTDGPEPCLVYQYMAGGSLERRLHPTASSKVSTPLSFNQRKGIALGTARGLQYLHTYIDGKPLIHGDIKPGNILLDTFCIPKIGDFGLVREGTDDPKEVSSVFGTKPYLPHEFLIDRIFSIKIDTFSFGVVLFELFTAERAFDTRRGDNKFLYKFMRSNMQMSSLIDKSLDTETVCVQLFEQLMQIGLDCTENCPEQRPEMVAVLKKLEELIV